MNKRLDLCGEWALTWDDGQRPDSLALLSQPDADTSDAIPASVPGEVHVDLVRAGVIAEPTVGMNSLSARWVQEMRWFYRRTFRVHPPRGYRVFLTFEGLDLVAAIHLNGVEVGRHANAFCPCTLDVTEALADGDNVLVVELESGLYDASVPRRPDTAHSPDGRLTRQSRLRKMQCSFGREGWPQLLNVGITGPVYLEICGAVRVVRVALRTTLPPDLAEGSVLARIHIVGLGRESRPGSIRLEIEEIDRLEETPIRISPGPQVIEATLRVAQPRLWWPAGHGAQGRYTARVSLMVNGALERAETRGIGFRHMMVSHVDIPGAGLRPHLVVNGKPVFLKGGTLAPGDALYTRVDRGRHERLVRRALEAGFNTLLVWGGGLYGADALYDACDRAGILVWQEFMFARDRYPGFDGAFLSDVARECAHQVRRLAHHPSLFAWSGNDLSDGDEPRRSGGDQGGIAYSDYAIFHDLLPRILGEEDGTRHYQPHSPYRVFSDPAPPSSKPQFPRVGGFVGPTSMAAAQGGLLPYAEANGKAAVRGGQTLDSLDDLVARRLGRHLKGMSPEEFVYWGGLAQGEALSEFILQSRRSMFATSSAVLWTYNDGWPRQCGWSIVDSGLRATPAYHPVRRAFQPLVLCISVEGGKVRIIGINDGPDRSAELRFGLFSLAGAYPLSSARTVELLSNSPTRLAEFDLSTWEELGVRRHGAFAVLQENGRELARHQLLLQPWADLELAPADVVVEAKRGSAVFRCDVFAWRVCVDLEGELGIADNFFDLLPGVPMTLSWPSSLPEPRVMRVGNPKG